MGDIIQEVTEEGLHLPRRLLEGLGYPAGRRVRITASGTDLWIRPAEATSDEICTLALRYLLSEVVDMAGILAPEQRDGRGQVPVVLRPAGEPIGRLCFSLDGMLLLEESDSPAALARAADAA